MNKTLQSVQDFGFGLIMLACGYGWALATNPSTDTVQVTLGVALGLGVVLFLIGMIRFEEA